MDKLIKLYTTYKDFEYYFVAIYNKSYTIYKGYNSKGKQIGKTDSMENSLSIIKSNVNGIIYNIEIEDK